MERNFFLLIYLLLFNTFLVAYDAFSYSAKITTHNHIVTHQEFSLSPLMIQKNSWDNTQKSFCKINKKKLESETAYNYLLASNSSLLECFLGKEIRVYGYDNYKQKLADTNTHFFIRPIRFTVDFKEDFANIYLLNP